MFLAVCMEDFIVHGLKGEGLSCVIKQQTGSLFIAALFIVYLLLPCTQHPGTPTKGMRIYLLSV